MLVAAPMLVLSPMIGEESIATVVLHPAQAAIAGELVRKLPGSGDDQGRIVVDLDKVPTAPVSSFCKFPPVQVIWLQP